MDSFDCGKQISPVVFYGSPHGVPPKRPSRLLLRLLHEIRVDLSEQSKSSLRYLFGYCYYYYFSNSIMACFNMTWLGSFFVCLFSKEIWSTFPRQDEAMKFAKGHDHARVFSYQDHFNGQRRFLVSTYKEFWKRLSFGPHVFSMRNLS